MTSITVRLADPSLKLPMPGQPGVFAPEGPFPVSAVDMFWAQCLADGSVVPVSETPPSPAEKPSAKPDAARADTPKGA